MADGTVRAWGWNGYGATSVPAGLNNVIAIAGGGLHSLALKSDGTVVAWGWNQFGQATVPAGLSDVVAIAGGIEHSLALKSDGTVVGWGANDGWASNDPNCQFIGSPCERKYTGQIDPPAGLNNVVAIKGGVFHSIALTVSEAEQAPSAPVIIVGEVSETSIALTWSDLANETGYRLEARVGTSGDWAEIANADANTTSYQHTGLTPGTTMFYRLQAFNSVGASPFSVEVSATTTTVSPVPAPPTLTATVLSHETVDLAWNDVDHESGYAIERRTDSGEWVEIATPAANATSFSDEGLTPATRYYYRIRALGDAGDSAFSAEVEAVTEDPPLLPPVAPSLSSSGHTHSEIALEWTDVADETGYKLEVKNSDDEWVELATLDAGVTTYNHEGLMASTTYIYRISSFNAAGSSALSDELSITTEAPPQASALTIEVLGTEAEGLRVRISGEAGQNFKVQRTSDFKSWTDVSNSTLLRPSMTISLPREDTSGFFRTVNTE
jgi:predicted phage tail protein